MEATIVTGLTKRPKGFPFVNIFPSAYPSKNRLATLQTVAGISKYCLPCQSQMVDRTMQCVNIIYHIYSQEQQILLRTIFTTTARSQTSVGFPSSYFRWCLGLVSDRENKDSFQRYCLYCLCNPMFVFIWYLHKRELL